MNLNEITGDASFDDMLSKIKRSTMNTEMRPAKVLDPAFVKGMTAKIKQQLVNATIDIEPYNSADFRLLAINNALEHLQSLKRYLLTHKTMDDASRKS